MEFQNSLLVEVQALYSTIREQMTHRRNDLIVYTIGHSTRPLEDFIALLRENKIELLVDVRTIPRSAHNPQFNEDTLPKKLSHEGIDYVHLKELGGLRHARPDSINTAWKNASFRGYADYMQTAEFEEGLKKLIDYAHHKRVAIMCAEAVPWRCHRSLIADAIIARSVQVYDIMGAHHVSERKLTPWARVQGHKVIYPA